MRSVITILSIVLFWATAPAQTLHEFSKKISHPTVDSLGHKSGVITVKECGDVPAIIESAASQSDSFIRVMRVVVYMENGQQARQEAMEKKELVISQFPEEPVSLVYENPYFKVIVGACLTQEEAVVLMTKLLPLFPKAFITRDDVKQTK